MHLFKRYSLNHCRTVLQNSYQQILKNRSHLNPAERDKARENLKTLQEAIAQKDRAQATQKARELEKFCSARFKKPFWRTASEVVVALLLALAIATVVRQMWFEPYEIPTGSMRPHSKSKTT